jgi:HAMP domain-containing protein
MASQRWVLDMDAWSVNTTSADMWSGSETSPTPNRCKSNKSKLISSCIWLAAQRNELHDLLMVSLPGVALTSVFSIGLSWVIAGRVLRPLRTITATTRDISATHPNRRLDLEGPEDVIRELRDTIYG